MIYFQFGARGAFLSMPFKSINRPPRTGYKIGDRVNINNMEVMHNTLGTYDLNGVWYVYGIESDLSGIMRLRMVRNSSKLAMRGDGSVIAANTIADLYNINGYIPDKNFYFTLRTDRTQYYSIIQAAFLLKPNAFPCFLPDGRIVIINMYDRGIVNPSIYSIFSNMNYHVEFKRSIGGVAEYELNKAILHVYELENIFYPPGTIIKAEPNANQAVYIADMTAVLGPNNTIASTRAVCMLLELKENK